MWTHPYTTLLSSSFCSLNGEVTSTFSLLDSPLSFPSSVLEHATRASISAPSKENLAVEKQLMEEFKVLSCVLDPSSLW